ncbi:putative hydrolase of the HAD superfamily [Rubidibacter lacunae KORDI 51-2]|uniref:Putative hydrolase of the HAD superfamily n=2 Tax=Rubidibacter TaxID=582491 RepID=U5D956_9CHRO|nr:putative hydrolase of the HAD superfamily [Rubidibacter lacunae KORDI 51-2]
MGDCNDPTDIQLLVLDIDGTIAGESNDVRPHVRAAVRAARERGICVTIATGRMYHSARRFAEVLAIDQPLVAYNGAWIQDLRKQQRLYHLGLPSALALQLLEVCEQMPLPLGVHLYVDDTLHVQHLCPATEAYRQRSNTDIVVSDLRALLVTSEPTKLLALSEDPEAISQLFDRLQQCYTPAEMYLTQSTATFFEACHPQVNKGAAVRYLAEDLLGLDASQVMAIGDNFNDLEMLQYAGVAVAMGSAPDTVRRVADWVAPDVEADGAAVAIDRFLLR